MNAQQISIDSIAHNLANASTVGFKSRRTQFEDLLYQNFLQPGASSSSQTVVPSGLQLGLGTRPSANSINFTQGSFQQSGNPLDVVIQGKGFFQIRKPDGTTAYTRAGNFQMDRDGNMVNAQGFPLEPQITLPAASQSVTIGLDGTVSYTLAGQNASQVAGQIQLANFTNPGGLNSIGDSLFMPTDASGDPTVGVPGGQEGVGTLQQGYTEASNVSVVDEFVNMIITQRAYEANTKVAKAADEMYQQVNNIAV